MDRQVGSPLLSLENAQHLDQVNKGAALSAAFQDITSGTALMLSQTDGEVRTFYSFSSFISPIFNIIYSAFC